MLQQSEFDQIAGRLRGLSRDGGTIEAAQVKLIGLDEIREAAGPRWPRMRERVRDGSLAILSQHTGPADVLIPAGDGFLVVLADGPPGSTQRRCQQMRDALLNFYLGEEALAALRPEVKNRALDADSLTDLISSSVQKKDEPAARMIARGLGSEIAHVRVLASQERRVGATLMAPVVQERGIRRMAYNRDFILDGQHSEPDYLELDIAVLDAALSEVSALRAADQAGVVGVSVHASTLQQRRSREAYLGWLGDVDADLRRYLFANIAEIEKGTPLISIAEWTSSLRAHIARVWLEFHYSDHAIGSVSGAGAFAAGFHLPVHGGAQIGPRGRRTADRLKFWAKSIHAQSMRLVVHGFQEQAFLAVGQRLGVDFATGDRFWPFTFPSQADATQPN